MKTAFLAWSPSGSPTMSGGKCKGGQFARPDLPEIAVVPWAGVNPAWGSTSRSSTEDAGVTKIAFFMQNRGTKRKTRFHPEVEREPGPV
jgi:hypothetical protein